jgi:hypothetical protein
LHIIWVRKSGNFWRNHEHKYKDESVVTYCGPDSGNSNVNIRGVCVRRNTKESIWERIDKKGEDECWEWMGPTTNDGYGRIGINRKYYSVHRLVYELTKGKIPNGKVVMHLCNNPPCCNPKHLRRGSIKDNVTQMYRENRDRHVIQEGELNNNSKLSVGEVIEIRKLYTIGNYSQRELGKQYGMSQGSISSIVNRRVWKNI